MEEDLQKFIKTLQQKLSFYTKKLEKLDSVYEENDFLKKEIKSLK